MNPPAPRAMARRLGLGDIVEAGSGLPSRLVVYGPEGSGKSSLAASSARPVFLMSHGETGLQTLLDFGLVPPTPHFPEIQTWSEWLDAIRALLAQPHEYRTLVVDTLNGAERL